MILKNNTSKKKKKGRLKTQITEHLDQLTSKEIFPKTQITKKHKTKMKKKQNKNETKKEKKKKNEKTLF